MAKWVVWYADESSFSSDDGEPWDCPREGVICITQYHESVGRFCHQETNFYCWHFEDSQWVPHDTAGLHQYLRTPGKEKVVLQGYWIPRDRYFAIRSYAMKKDTSIVALRQPGAVDDPLTEIARESAHRMLASALEEARCCTTAPRSGS